jgi:hypothetical protein
MSDAGMQASLLLPGKLTLGKNLPTDRMSDPEPDQPGGLMAATLELVVKLARHSNLVNRLEAEGRVNRQGPIADYLTRLNFVIVDELGYLPSPNAANCCSITSASFMTAPKSPHHQPRLRRMAERAWRPSGTRPQSNSRRGPMK